MALGTGRDGRFPCVNHPRIRVWAFVMQQVGRVGSSSSISIRLLPNSNHRPCLSHVDRPISIPNIRKQGCFEYRVKKIDFKSWWGYFDEWNTSNTAEIILFNYWDRTRSCRGDSSPQGERGKRGKLMNPWKPKSPLFTWELTQGERKKNHLRKINFSFVPRLMLQPNPDTTNSFFRS